MLARLRDNYIHIILKKKRTKQSCQNQGRIRKSNFKADFKNFNSKLIMRIKGCLYVIQSEPHQEDKIIVIGYAKYIVTDFYKMNRTISTG